MTDFYAVASEMLEAGLQPLPLALDKRPVVPEWTSYRDRLLDEPVDQFYHCDGIGLVCGKVSGNLEVIDFDLKHDPNRDNDQAMHLAWKRYLSAVAPSIAGKLLYQSTQSGGFHAIYRVKGEVGRNQKLASIRHEGKVHTVIETRGEGGYIMISPSPGYAFLRKGIHHIPTLTLEQREHVLNAAKSLNQVEAPHHIPKGHVEAPGGSDRPGDKFNENPSPTVPQMLTDAGWEVIQVSGEVVRLRRPGKRSGSLSATWNAVPNRLYVFSSNASPFESEKTYSPFEVYTFLHHQGNFHESAHELAGKGYGKVAEPPVPVRILDPHDSGVPFPMEAFSDLIQVYSNHLHFVFNVPAEACAMACLGAVSAAIGKWSVYTNGSNHDKRKSWPNLYILMGLPSGIGKTVMERIWQPLKDADTAVLAGFNDEYGAIMATVDDLETELRLKRQELTACRKAKDDDAYSQIDPLKDRIAAIHNQLNEIMDPRSRELRKPATIFSSGGTSEGLVRHLVVNKACKECTANLDTDAGDHLEMLVGGLYRQGKDDMDFDLAAWSGDMRDSKRAGTEHTRLEEPCQAKLLMVQPYKVQEMLAHRRAKDRGLTARYLLYQYSDRIPEEEEHKKEVDPRLEHQWRTLLLSLAALRQKRDDPVEIPCTDDARAVFFRYHKEMIRRSEEDWSGYAEACRKARQNALRVALCFAWAQGDDVIHADTAINATKVVNYCLHVLVETQSLQDVKYKQEDVSKVVEYLEYNEDKEAPLYMVKRVTGLSDSQIENLARAASAFDVVPGKRGNGKRVVMKGVNNGEV